ncbi:inositol polyphosphate 1-phosphatase [Strigomonas culicis]|nr:inositol polyphosphate 1-phosphatase [Strigomonas culicis]|eukprot:EPY25690.1 inositol polyphosphate 1-phosphatase [Strigomonas culicis]
MASIDILDLLLVLARGTLAAQQYIANDLLKLHQFTFDAASVLELEQSEREQLVDNLKKHVQVDVKAELGHKEGDAAKDLVTTADVLTQAVLATLMAGSTAGTPYTMVGEEDAPDAAVAPQVDRCLATYYSPALRVPHQEVLRAHVQRTGGRQVVAADSVEALRRRVGVFIDPIDGTNCFVQGVWEAPMTLAGITVDGVPVAAVANRVFIFPLGGAELRHEQSSLSYVWNFEAMKPFMVFEGKRVEKVPTPALPSGAVLRVAQSSTTQKVFLEEVNRKLEPSEPVYARGAGNKEFFLIQEMLKTQISSIGTSDVFICSGDGVKKWDTCAPHAFIYALGGDIYEGDGEPVRYDVTLDDKYSLRKGVVACTHAAATELEKRMGWHS